jgi:hypothetical protein
VPPARGVVIERWTGPRFLEEAHAWIAEQVEPTAPIEQPHVRAWSTVLRVPTGDGDLFFKANAPLAEHEAAILEQLGPLAPDVLPEVVAIDAERRWFLLRDAGPRLREQPIEGAWVDVLGRYADVQVAAAPSADALVAAGVPDRRGAMLPGLYESLGGDPRIVAELWAELERLGLPETIQHDDLHDGQVFLRDGRTRILDWGDACVSHPFLTFGVAAYFLDDAAVDAYLGRWGDPVALRAAVPGARRLAGVSRALTWRAVGEIAPPDRHDDYATGQAMWVQRVATEPERWGETF